MVEPKPIQKGVYRHFKGGLYEVVDTVIDSETLETLVLYRPLGTPWWWVRPYAMFTETVESDGKRVLRFQLEEAQ
jgi:hypothetical protein